MIHPQQRGRNSDCLGRGTCQRERRKHENDWHDDRHQTADHNQPFGWHRSPDVSDDGLDSHQEHTLAGAGTKFDRRLRARIEAAQRRVAEGRAGNRLPQTGPLSKLGANELGGARALKKLYTEPCWRTQKKFRLKPIRDAGEDNHD